MNQLVHTTQEKKSMKVLASIPVYEPVPYSRVDWGHYINAYSVSGTLPRVFLCVLHPLKS